jgi:hypothetical protein
MPDIRRLDALIKPSKTDKGDGKQPSHIFVTQDMGSILTLSSCFRHHFGYPNDRHILQKIEV